MSLPDKNAVYKAQSQFLQRMNNVGDLGLPIILCGGTALARAYLHHRTSYDLDFFVGAKFNPEQLASNLSRNGIALRDVQIELGEQFVAQLFGFFTEAEVDIKVSFVEDNYAGMFATTVKKIDGAPFTTEVIEGLYHRKLRTVSGSGQSDIPRDGRQTARDLFDLLVLDYMIKPIPIFIQEINRDGANFPVKAFTAGLGAMPWLDMMDEFSQLDYDKSNPLMENMEKNNVMATVRNRMQIVFKEMANYG